MVMGNQDATDMGNGYANFFQRFADSAGTDAGIYQKTFLVVAHKIAVATAATGKTAYLKLNRK